MKPLLVLALTTGRLDMKQFTMAIGLADFRVYVQNTETYGDPDEVMAWVVVVVRGLRVHLVRGRLIDALSAHPQTPGAVTFIGELLRGDLTPIVFINLYCEKAPPPLLLPLLSPLLLLFLLLSATSAAGRNALTRDRSSPPRSHLDRRAYQALTIPEEDRDQVDAIEPTKCDWAEAIFDVTQLPGGCARR